MRKKIRQKYSLFMHNFLSFNHFKEQKIDKDEE